MNSNVQNTVESKMDQNIPQSGSGSGTKDRKGSGSDQDPIEDRMGIKLKKGTEALDEASVQT